MAKKFRVATEGATTDGREIQRNWIEEMAETYDPSKYGARVWMEHMRGMYADGPFAAMGDVTAVTAEEVEGGKLALFAEIDPTDQLKQINKNRQKIYSSIEINHNFAGTGKAYLEGMAVTDSPASLGTEMLKFSRTSGAASPLAARKQNPENLFSEAVAIELDFTEAPAAAPEKTGLADLVKSLFKKHDAKSAKGFEAFHADLESAFEEFATRHAALADELDARPTAEQFSQLQTAHADLKAKFDALYSKLDTTPDQPRRHSTGGDGQLTNC